MALQIRRIDPREMREPIVDFFWRIRMWPYPTREQYFRLWDWRQQSLSDQDPVAWVALDGTTVVGNITVLFRALRIAGRPVRAGISANYRVEEAHRSGPVSGALASAPRMLVRSGEVDLMLGFGNAAGHRLAVATGQRELGRMRIFAQVLRWAPMLRQRSAILVALAPLLSATARARSAVRRARAGLPDGLTGRVLAADEIVALDRSHWHRGAGLTWDGSLTSFANHFCPSEFRSSRVIGVLDQRSGRLEGLVALDGTNHLQILQCEVNEAALSAVQAVGIAARAQPGAESVRVPLLPHTAMAGQFRDAGYFQLPDGFSPAVFRDTCWSAYWLGEHALAAGFADTRAWQLWYGWSHH
ncbi:MAG: hypothetical protein JSR67_11700 [Proteobacteria bacterium]|nr:hypothetical protein [Pseudomonadota bacterium]